MKLLHIYENLDTECNFSIAKEDTIKSANEQVIYINFIGHPPFSYKDLAEEFLIFRKECSLSFLR